mgnify:CR=1 FL=1
MRDPLRIPSVLLELCVFWSHNPDLRLGQILVNMAEGSPFFMEDDKALSVLKEWNAHD